MFDKVFKSCRGFAVDVCMLFCRKKQNAQPSSRALLIAKC
jgi:hypothetical protein